MRFVLERVSEPEIEPITLAAMKEHLREFAGVTSHDAQISGLIKVAREWAETLTGRVMIDQEWRQTIGDTLTGGPTILGDSVAGYQVGSYDWPTNGELRLYRSPVIALVSFVSLDAAGAETPLDQTTYQLLEQHSKWPRIVPLSGANWSAGRFKIVFRAGFADRGLSPQQGAEVVPGIFLQAMKLYTEAHYDRDYKTMQLLLDVAENLLKLERADLQIA